MSRRWLGQRERGSLFLMRLIIWIALHIGRRAGRVLLYPICAYFVLFSIRARQASRDFLSRVQGSHVGLADVFRHYHTYAATLLDRVYLLTGKHDTFHLEVHGAERLQELVEQNRGCLLLGSHMGSFEILRVLGILEKRLPIKVLFYEQNSQKISSLLNALNPDIAASVIHANSFNAMLEINECLEQGYLIGIMGDRLVNGGKPVTCRFLGEQAQLPAGPLLLAHTLKVPVVLCFGLYRGDRRYEIHLEWLADKINLDHKTRDGDLQRWAQAYAARLEHYCRLAPYNWFNFYDFWEKDEHPML